MGAGMVPRRAGLSPGVRARTRPQFPRRDTVPRRCGVGQTRKRVCILGQLWCVLCCVYVYVWYDVQLLICGERVWVPRYFQDATVPRYSKDATGNSARADGGDTTREERAHLA